MIKILNIPTSWQNITWKQYEDYLNKPDFLQIWGITEEIFFQNKIFIEECLEFLKETPKFPIKKQVSVNNDTFGKYVEYVFCLQNNLPLLDILAIYEGVVFEEREAYKASKQNEKIFEEAGVVYEIIKQTTDLEKDVQAHANNYKIPLRREEKAVGVEGYLQKWGYYAVIANMAGSVLYHKAIENLPTYEVLGRLKYDIETRYITWRLQEEQRIEIENKINSKRR